MTLIIAGGIVRDRAWSLPRHLDAVRKNFPSEMLYLTTSGNSDDTLQILWDSGVNVEVEDEPWAFSERPGYNTMRLAERRNRWAELALQHWPSLTHLWVVDSDIVPAQGALQLLLSVDADIVGAGVPIPSQRCPEPMEGWRLFPEYSRYMAFRNKDERTREEPHPATLVGSCYLIRRRALEAGLQWEDHQQSESAGLCECARRLRLSVWWHPKARCGHLTREGSQ